jgi:hypothetical protein
MKVIDVILPRPLSIPFYTYRLNDEFVGRVSVGSRVLVLLTLLLVDGELNKSDYYF